MLASIWLATAARAGEPAAPATPAAEESDLDLSKLLNLRVITASGGVEEERSLAPASVEVFTRDEIARYGWRSLTDLLQNVPGLDVVDDHVMPSVGVRGVTGGFRAGTRIVKVMIDGMAVNFRPDLVAFIGPEYIPIEAIDRVEIAKGPLSAIYGANAFLAVVNVITLKASTGAVAAAKLRSNLTHGGLGYGASGVLSDKLGALELVAAFSFDRVDRSGLRISKTIPVQDPTQPRFAPFFASASQDDIARPLSGFLSLRVPSSVGAVTLEGGVQRLNSAAEFQLSSVLTHQSRVAIDNYWSRAQYDKTWVNGVGVLAKLGYARGAPTGDEILYLTSNYDSSFKPNYGYSAVDGALQLSYRPEPRLSTTLGGDASYEFQRTLYYTQTFLTMQGMNAPGSKADLIGATDARTVTPSNIGAYGGITYAPVPDLHLTANGRLDVPNLFPVQYSWRSAVSYRLNPKVTLKVFAGRAFQVPSGVLLYGHSGFGASNNVIGNRTLTGVAQLRPQIINSVEAAASASPSRYVTIESNLYYQRIQDRIEFTQAGGDFIARNRGTGQNVGVELTSKGHIARTRPFVSVALQRTLVDGALDGAPPPLYPNLWLRTGVDVDVPEAHLRPSAQLRWVGARGASQSNVLLNNNQAYELPGYAEVDVSVSTVGLRPARSGPEIGLTLRGHNLLDSQKPVPGFGGFDVPALGRVIMLEVALIH